MYSAFGVDHGDIEKGLGSFLRGLGRGAKGVGSTPIHSQLAAGGKAQKLNIPKGGSIYDQMTSKHGAPGASAPKSTAKAGGHRAAGRTSYFKPGATRGKRARRF